MSPASTDSTSLPFADTVPGDGQGATPVDDTLRRPWRRFLARMMDYWLLMLAVGFIVGALLALLSLKTLMWTQQPHSTLLLAVLLAPFVMALEALIFAVLGTTPGKWLLNVKVTLASGQRPTLWDYMRRQVKVYVFGVAGWLPLISLFSAAHQHGKVRDGKAAGYDEGHFQVRVYKLQPWKAGIATLAFIGLMAVNGHFKHESRESDQRYAVGGAWTNRVSGKAVDIPPGWTHQTSRNDDKQEVDMFFHPASGIYAVFAKDNVPADMGLEDYAAAWVHATTQNMRLYVSSDMGTVDGEPALVVLGNLSSDKSHKVHATLVKLDSAVWRVVVVSTSGRSPDGEDANQLRHALFASVR